MDTNITVHVPHTWSHVRIIRERVGEALRGAAPALRSAAMMTASELTENAVKYGEDVPEADHVAFAMWLDESRVTIRVSNGTRDKLGVRELQRRVDEVRSTPDKAALYVARLEELLVNSTESGKLGIYRIAFEGGFALQCDYIDDVVTVTATRERP
jgi:hypothetical protein